MEIRKIREKATLFVRTTTSMEKISEAMGKAYGEIAQYMGKKGLPFDGPPYALYRNMDMNALDVEMGFPLAEAAEGEGRVKAGMLPGGEAAVALHTGPYTELGGTYELLTKFVEEKGRIAEQWCYEFYLNSPMDTPPENLRTEIYFPLKN